MGMHGGRYAGDVEGVRGDRMTQREAGLVVALAICLGVIGGILYAWPGGGETLVIAAPTPVDWGYAVGPGWQMTPTPESEQALAVATVTPEPTYAWLQPGRDVSCERLGQIHEAAMNYSCREALIASQLADAHVVIALRTEPGAQLTNIHEFGTSQGTYYYMLFEQALMVWKENDARILVASPVNGCWQGLPQPTLE